MSDKSIARASEASGNYWINISVSLKYVWARLQSTPKRYPRICNICGYEGYFGPAGGGTRIDAKCPRCKSAERYRLFKLWLDGNRDIVEGKDVLHFAPEKSLGALIKPLAKTYRTADITPGRAELVLNIEEIALLDKSVDCVVCSHVLEHVDDKKALTEIFRILRPGGHALIMVPMVEGWRSTYENPSIRSDSERTLHFGQFDHVRYYGADIRDRIRSAGFSLDEFTADGSDSVRYGLIRGEKVFVATRSA